MDTETLKMVTQIAHDVDNVGGTAYFVGGHVRDKFLNVTPKDTDLEVYGVVPASLRALLEPYGKVSTVGESFGVFKLGDIDVAIPRKETSTGRSHKSLDVDADPWLDPRRACARRDFTFNAMLENVLTGEILDYYGGRNDLKAMIVRAVNDKTFTEDPLRMIRAAKMAARFGFIIAQDTASLIRARREDITNLPSERIFGELSDILMKSQQPSYGIRLLDELGLLEIMLPEIWALKAVEQNPLYHPEGSVFNHLCQGVDYFPIEQRTLIEQLAIMWHDVGKLYGTREHDLNSVKIIREVFPARLTTDTAIINGVCKIVENHMSLYGGSVTKARVRRLASKVDIYAIVRMGQADRLSRPLPEEQLNEGRAHLQKFITVFEDVSHEIKPIIRGRDILENHNIEPGPLYSKILNQVYNLQLDGVFSDHETGLQILDLVIKGQL